MAAEFKVQGFVKGIQNKLPAEDIDTAAGSEGLNWASVDGKLETIRGRRNVGSAGAVGGIYGEIWAPKVDGSSIHFVKRDTDIGYYDDDEVYHSVITGLTAGSVYTFSTYSSLAGNYLYATGPDGLFKIAVANPDSYKNMYFRRAFSGFQPSESTNYLGHSIIQDRRMFLWNRFDDVQNKTTLFVSKLDPMDGSNYQTVESELMGTGNGSNTTFTYTLAEPSETDSTAFAFGLDVYSDELGLFKPNVTNIVPAADGYVTLTVDDLSGFQVGDYLHINDDFGTPDPNEAEIVAAIARIEGQITRIAQINVPQSEIIVYLPDYDEGGVPEADFTVGSVTRLRSTVVEDDNNGGWQNSVAGTIDYSTGDISVTLPYTPGNNAPVYVYYLYEDSNNNGITDFSSDDITDNTQGLAIPQDYAGEAIQKVLVFEGSYYSLKKTSVYILTPAMDWSTYMNEIYRVNTGIPFMRAAVSSAQGIVYMDTGNPSRPILTLLQRSTVGGNLQPVNMTPLFKWENYEFDQCLVKTWGQNIIVSCRTPDSATNNRLMLVNFTQEYSVDITNYGANTSATKEGYLYLGSPTHNTVWEAFSGFDDLGLSIQNTWSGKQENYGEDALKKVRYMQFKGLIDEEQAVEVYAEYDNDEEELLGTILGSGDYVDLNDPHTVGTVMLGDGSVGGGSLATVYPFLHQLKIRTPKFRVRCLRFEALNIGYFALEWNKDFDILRFEQRIPAKYRVRNYVALDGAPSDLPNMP